MRCIFVCCFVFESSERSSENIRLKEMPQVLLFAEFIL